jgi:PAS domain S-box-containing protein
MSRPDPTVTQEWVLLIEDDADSCDALRILLEDSGFVVETASSGRLGLEAFARRPWDLVFLDLQLPELSGLEVLRAIKAASPVTPVIVITGHGSMATAVDAVNESAFAYLQKPVSFDALLQTATRALARRRREEGSRRLAAIVEGSEDAIIGKTLEGTIVTWNAAAERLYGYAPPEVLGRSIALLMPPDRADELPDILARLRRGERIEPYETVRVRQDGSRVDVSLTISPVRDASGSVIGASAIARDITRRKRAEATTRALIQISHELAGSLELEQVTARVTRTVLDLLHTRRAALFRRDPASGVLTCVAIAGGDDRGWLGQTLPPGVAVAGLAVSLGAPVWTPDLLRDPRITVPEWLGERLAAEGLRAAAGVPLLEGEEVLGVLTLADVPNRVFTADELEILFAFAAQAALAIRNARLFEEIRGQRDFLQSVAENSADGIVTTDVRGRLTYVSPGAARMLGHPAEAVLGRRVASFYRGGRAEAWAVAKRLRQQGKLRNHETALQAGDGVWVPVSVSVSLLRDAQGRLVGTLGIIHDLSDREAAEAARREVSEFRTVTLLAGGVAHEVNNPLAVIVGQLELLLAVRPPDRPEAMRIERALAAAREIRDIVARLAKLARIETTRADKLLPPILDIRRSAGESAP